jgi:GNAT superfamily N-acetyltransferase
MTQTQTRTASHGVRGVTIRSYRPSDHNACRALWAELTEHQGRLHPDGDPRTRERMGGDDAGAGFEDYLTQLNLSGMWVAEQTDGGVVGFVGLMLGGRSGEVDPVIVTASMRGRGLGRELLAKVAAEASRRGQRRLTVSPPLRDEAALRAVHAAGFATIATVTLSYDLAGTRAGAERRGETLELHDLRFGV